MLRWVEGRLFEEAGAADTGGGTGEGSGDPPPQTPPKTDPQMTEVQQRIARMEQESLQLRQSLAQQRVNNAPPPQTPDKADLTKKFFEDPVGMSAAISQRAAWEAQQQAAQNQGHTLETLAEIARDKARGEGFDAEVFDKYQEEIYAAISQVHPQYRTNINIWRTAINNVKGAHMSEIIEMKKGSSGAPNGGRAADGPAAVGNRAPAVVKDKISAEENEWATKLRITPEQYAAGKRDVDNQNEYGKSSWDAHMTFDEKTGRANLERSKKRAVA